MVEQKTDFQFDRELDFSAIRELFTNDQYHQLSQFAQLLGSVGVERGLIGPREADRIWSRHILNCAALVPLLPDSGNIVDLGSGAGLPGVVVAILRQRQQVILLEPLLRRENWLLEITERLALRNVQVIRGRAEDEAGKLKAAVVVSRAVARFPKLLTWSRPLLDRGGELIALKGSSVAEEIAEVTSAQRAGWIWPPKVSKLALLPGVEFTTAVELIRR